MNPNCPACLDTVKRAYDQRFPYYGDLWLAQRQVFNKMTISEVIQLGTQSGVFLIPINEMAYIDGSKMGLTVHQALLSGINRCIDKDIKYKDIVEKRNKSIKIIKFGEKPIDKSKSQMFG